VGGLETIQEHDQRLEMTLTPGAKKKLKLQREQSAKFLRNSELTPVKA
jgi:hypothetical protein